METELNQVLANLQTLTKPDDLTAVRQRLTESRDHWLRLAEAAGALVALIDEGAGHGAKRRRKAV